jgi:hypothetical protein
MENVIETYELPYDPEVPVVVMDEQPVQLFNEVRQPIPATRRHARRVDYEYARAGVADIFSWPNRFAAGVESPSVNIKRKSIGRTRYESSLNRIFRTLKK